MKFIYRKIALALFAFVAVQAGVALAHTPAALHGLTALFGVGVGSF